MKHKILISGTMACAIMLSSQVFAQSLVESNVGGFTIDRDATDKTVWTLGLGVGTTPDYEGGDDYEAVPIPIIRAQNGNRFAELIGLHAKSNFLDSERWRLGTSFNFRQGYSDVDNNRVDSLTNRGSSYELGIIGGYVIPLQGGSAIELSLEVLADISSGHDGALVTPSVDYHKQLNPRWLLGLGASTTWADGNYMSHYFSVNRRDSIDTGLDEYDADRDFKDAEVHVSAHWEWTEKWHLHAIAQYKRMLGDAEDSPIVDDEGDENQFFGGLAFTYTW